MMPKKIFQGLNLLRMMDVFALIISAVKILLLTSPIASLVAQRQQKIEQVSPIRLLQLGLIREEK